MFTSEGPDDFSTLANLRCLRPAEWRVVRVALIVHAIRLAERRDKTGPNAIFLVQTDPTARRQRPSSILSVPVPLEKALPDKPIDPRRTALPRVFFYDAVMAVIAVMAVLA